MMNRRRHAQARPALWLLLLALLLGCVSPLASIAGVAEEDPPAVEATDVPVAPTLEPTGVPVEPTTEPPSVPTDPTVVPTAEPSLVPSAEPTNPGPEPSMVPTVEPSERPTEAPAGTPTATLTPTPAPEASLQMGIQAIEPTGNLTKTASTINPAPGEAITFTISVFGEAEAGTSLNVLDIYQSGAFTVSEPQIGETTNITTPRVEPDANTYTVSFSPVTTGGYSLTFDVDATVGGGASGLITAGAALFAPPTGGELSDDSVYLTVNTGPVTKGTISKTVSTANPVPGELVTFTITATGEAEAGTELQILDVYQQFNGVTVGPLRVSNASNVTDPAVSLDTGGNGYLVGFSLVTTGTFALTFEVDATVAPGATGTLDAPVELKDTARVLAATVAKLTVTPGTITPKVAVSASISDDTPVPGQVVTVTLVISGRSVPGADLTLDYTSTAAMRPVGDFVTIAHQNVSPGATGHASNGLTLPIAVLAPGVFSATVTIDVEISETAGEGTVATNTACVDVTNGPQDTCAAVEVTVQPLTAIDRLIQLLIEIVQDIIRGL